MLSAIVSVLINFPLLSWAMWDDTNKRHGPGRSDQLLQQIADALGLPREAFLGSDPPSTQTAQTGELMRLWSRLDRDADRQRTLQFMRALATGRTDA